MSRKKAKVAGLIEPGRAGDLDPHYTGFFDHFNRGLYFESHEVLEQLWLKERKGSDDLFYKGLIQLAGAFVHLQKGRPGPASALFNLAQKNLGKYPARHHRLHLAEVLDLIAKWRGELEQGRGNPLGVHPPPRIVLQPA